MRKAVEEYLEGRGCRVMRPPAEPAPPTLESLVDGFLVHVLRLDPESYRRAFWHEAYRNGHTLGHVPRTFGAFFRRNARTFEQQVSLLLALAALFGVYTMATLLYRRLSLLVKRLRRPTYYERERERRRKLAEARREIRRHHTLNPKPTFDAIRAALRVAHGSPEDALRLGSLLEDLECFVDNTLIHDAQGQIVGRRGGIKRLLQREASDLFAKYCTIMRYKAMAKRFRQACGSGEPVPPAMLLPASEVEAPGSAPVSSAPAPMPTSSPADAADGLQEVKEGRAVTKDYKTALQELLQAEGLSAGDIQYVDAGQSGPDHDKVFTVKLIVAGSQAAEGEGKSKKQAQQNAARAALSRRQHAI